MPDHETDTGATVPPDIPGARRSRLPITRHRAALIIILGYSGLSLSAKWFLAYLESTQGYDDNRDIQASLVFASIMAALCIRSLIKIYR